jgi:Voltage-dependent anion channel
MTGGQPGHAWLRDLNPGYFALVMATGIVARAAFLDGATVLAAVLLAVAAAAYVVLVAAYGWRFARYRREFLADASDPVKAFAFFTFVAGSNVLRAGLAADHLAPITAGLLLIAGLAWLLLGYGIPGTLITARAARPALSGANGTWSYPLWYLWRPYIVYRSRRPACRAGYRRPEVAQDRCPVLSAADRQLYLARPPQRPCR